MMIIAQLFNGANLFVLPFWALMILLPNWGLTRRIMGSLIPYILLGGLYLYLIVGTITPETAEALSNPKLADIAGFFSQPRAAATGWVHFLVMDLFVGRWIYWQGQHKGVWTVHSLVLSLFAGPLGLLSHILTGWLTQKFSPDQDAANPTVATDP